MLDNYVQLRMYLDDTITLDLYGDPSDNSYAANMADLYRTFKRRLESELLPNIAIRANPYLVTKCNDCGQFILTNRDVDSDFTCKNCESKQRVIQITNDSFDGAISKFEKLTSINRNQLNQHKIYLMFANVPDNKEAILMQIMLENSYEQILEHNGMFRQMIAELYHRGIIEKVTEKKMPIMFSKSVTDEIEYNHNVRSVQKIITQIRRSVDVGIFSISTTIDVKSTEYPLLCGNINDELRSIESAIDKMMSNEDAEIDPAAFLAKANNLIMQKRYKEARDVVDFVLQIAPNDTNAKHTLEKINFYENQVVKINENKSVIDSI